MVQNKITSTEFQPVNSVHRQCKLTRNLDFAMNK